MNPQAHWRRSSYSGGEGGACVEVVDGLTHVLPVRDSKNPDGPVLAFGRAGWSSFVEALKSGELSA